MEHTFIEILRRALDEELARDASVYLLGEDVAAGGAFGVTRGLAQKHGDKRVRNTPISEAAITGLATGAALCGLKPVLEIMFIDFATLAMDCLVNQTAKYRYMSGGQLAVPLVVRTQAGAAGGAAAQHSQSLEAWFVHVPGLVVVAPSSPAEAYGLLKSAIRLGDPLLFIEHKRLYTMKEALADDAELPPIGKARIARAGKRCHRDRVFGHGERRTGSGRDPGARRVSRLKSSICGRWCRSTWQPSLRRWPRPTAC
jgi:pyruvate dehydrogenase E1 component beta subunit